MNDVGSEEHGGLLDPHAVVSAIPGTFMAGVCAKKAMG